MDLTERAASREPAGLVEAFPELEAAFSDAGQFGLPMSLAVARMAPPPDAEGQDREALCRRLREAFSEECRVAPVDGNRFAVLLLGRDQFPDLVRIFELALERLARWQRGRPALCVQFGVARCPLDGDELPALLALAEQVLSDVPAQQAAFDFVDRRHRRHRA
jgi:hypothetical protein